MIGYCVCINMVFKTMEFVKAVSKDVLQRSAEKFASYNLGQYILRKVDRCLWILEKSSQWAVQITGDKDDKDTELVRPLPWIAFIVLLVMLRIFREAVSFINQFRGQPPLRAGELVSFVQSRRRYVRALKYQGTRNLRAKVAKDTQALASNAYQMFSNTLNLAQTTVNNCRAHITVDTDHSDEKINGRSHDSNENLNDDEESTDDNKAENNSSTKDDTPTMKDLIVKMVDMYSSSEDPDYTLSSTVVNKANDSAFSDDDPNSESTLSGENVRMASTPKKRDNDESILDKVMNISDLSSYSESFIKVNEERQIRKPNRMANGKTGRRKNGGANHAEGGKKSNESLISFIKSPESNLARKMEGSYSQKSTITEPNPPKKTEETVKPQPKEKKSKLNPPFWKR